MTVMEHNKEFLDLLLDRRSCRAFRPDALDRPTLAAIVETGRYAPSAMDTQQNHFYIITDQKLLKQLSELVSRKLEHLADRDFRYGAPALVLVTNRKDHAMAPQDAACAMENMFLAAHSLGIGSVWINQLQDVCDVPAIRQVLDELGIPADHVVYGMAALGYPDDVKADKARTGKVVYVD